MKTPDGTQKMLVKAPTGSGKTIILIGLLEQMEADYPGKYVYCWLTPGKGGVGRTVRGKNETIFTNVKYR